ncbi:MAG: chemotaxis protein CheW [Aeromonas sp.]
MNDSIQVQAMDDYFHSLLLDEPLELDEPLARNKRDEREAELAVLARQPVRQHLPEVAVAPYLESDPRLAQLDKLLAQVAHVQLADEAATPVPAVAAPRQTVAEQALLPVALEWPTAAVEPERVQPHPLTVSETAPPLAPASAPVIWENIDTGNEFQALFFDVAGVTFAVPLTELGGIHQLGEITSLFGQPQWYKGIMTSREQQMNVVDTAHWVMPGQDLQMDDYQYLIMLGESSWGLACHHLKGTELLQPHQVKWRHQEGKRPWLAGLVKEKMCALLHVRELLLLLERGVNIAGR